MKYLKKNGELKDGKIIEALRTAADMYENGEIVEVRDMLLEIQESLEEFIRVEANRG